MEKKSENVGKNALALVAHVKCKKKEVRNVCFAVAKAAVSRDKGNIWKVAQSVGKTFVTGSPSTSTSKTCLAGNDTDICTPVSASNSVSAQNCIVSIRSILSPVVSGIPIAEPNGVPHNPLEVVQNGPLYTSSSTSDYRGLCKPMTQCIEWNFLALEQGESQESAIGNSLFGDIEDRRNGIVAAWDAEPIALRRVFEEVVRASEKAAEG